MLVWIYAGGGHAESVLEEFFEGRFKEVAFDLKTPRRVKLGPKANKRTAARYDGNTGESLATEIREQLKWWDGSAQVMLIIDDLDCDDAEKRRTLLSNAAKSLPEGYPVPLVLIGLAVPEIEAWLIADWGGTFDKNSKFKPCSQPLKKALLNAGVPVENPEDFDCAKYGKLSRILENEAASVCKFHYSKQTDTPDLFLQINPESVAAKCPHFREFWRELKRTLEPATT